MKKWASKYFFTILGVIILLIYALTALNSYSDGNTYFTNDDSSTNDDEFNWNDQKDLQNFLEWKEDNGSGWSNN